MDEQRQLFQIWISLKWFYSQISFVFSNMCSFWFMPIGLLRLQGMLFYFASIFRYLQLGACSGSQWFSCITIKSHPYSNCPKWRDHQCWHVPSKVSNEDTSYKLILPQYYFISKKFTTYLEELYLAYYVKDFYLYKYLWTLIIYFLDNTMTSSTRWPWHSLCASKLFEHLHMWDRQTNKKKYTSNQLLRKASDIGILAYSGNRQKVKDYSEIN